MADLGQRSELIVRHADVERIGVILLQEQRRDDRDEIGVAAALAKPVQRALDLPGARAHRGERIRDRVLGVVMRVDADAVMRDVLGDLGDDALDLMWQRAAIGVAEDDPARASLVGRAWQPPAHRRDWPCSHRRNARNRAWSRVRA